MPYLWIVFLHFACLLSLIAEEERWTSSLDNDYICNTPIHQNKEELTDFVAMDDIESTLSAECQPLATVGGCVNVISGQFFHVERDLQSHTIEPLDFVRYYESGNEVESLIGYGFGSGFPLWASEQQKGKYHLYGMISERENFLLLYRDQRGGQSPICKIDPRLLKKGCTNLGRGILSGQTNFVNYRAQFFPKTETVNSQWKVWLGDGTKRIYDQHVKLEKGLRSRMQFPTESAYLLTREIKPNGNQVLFSHSTKQGQPYLKSIETKNRVGKTIHKLQLSYEKGKCKVSDDFGNEVVYYQEEKVRPYQTGLGIRHVQKNFLTKVVSTQRPDLQYEMENFTFQMRKIKKPQGRALKIEYFPNGQVQALSTPQETKTKIERYRFAYHSSSTDVFDAIGQLSSYHFDEDKRLSHIRYFDQSRLVRQDVFEWSHKEEERGWLKSKSIQIGNHIYFLKACQYDNYGNVKQETLYGNLTGEKAGSFSSDQRDNMDQWTLNYTYFPQGNLLKEKATPEGVIFSYEYEPHTNLCTKILCSYQGRIQERMFKSYDDNGQLQTLIEDNGSDEQENDLHDVSFKKVKIIEETIQESGLAFGKPKRIKEYYLDRSLGDLIPKKQTFFEYDAKGCEKRQEIIDSQGRSFVTTKEYNSYFQLIAETNPLGHQTIYDYDANGNKFTEKLIAAGKTILYKYDFADRLKEKKEFHLDGETFVTSYQYNALDQLISETDPYGQQTTYQYDRLGNLIQCVKPSLQGKMGSVLHPTMTRAYNLLNQMISKTDEKGQTTHYTYNSYGNPTKIIYPDGAKERFVYYLCGWLKEKIQADGTSLFYQYDEKGHLIKKIYKDYQGTEVKKEEYRYIGPFPQSYTDGKGLVTTYTYDGAGRKIKETIGGLKTIDYAYDDFDRLIEKREETRVETFAYDALDHLIEKQVQENGVLISKEAYTYDSQGNQKTKAVWQSPSQTAVYLAHYHPDGSLAWQEDPLTHRTTYTYHHHLPYALGNYVKAKTMHDPLDRVSIETYDPLQQLSQREIFDQGHSVSRLQWIYDPCGHCIEERAFVMHQGQLIREYWIERTYNKRGLLKQETEMPAGKVTSYHYDLMNRLSQKTKPDDVLLNYTCDALGRLKTLTSSDKTISYTYTYDLHDNIIKVQDHVNQKEQNRWFDLWNRLEKEEMSPNIFLHYEYDVLDRLKKLILPDGSWNSYTYEAYHLQKIQRFNSSNILTYEIECLEHDGRGNPLAIQSPAGITHYTYDLLGRVIKIASPSWETHLKQFDAVGNLLKMQQKDPNGTIDGQLSYDRFNQLTHENTLEAYQYAYDSLGNCLQKNGKAYDINALNQLKNDGQADYAYDPNGNLKEQSFPPATYTYDALNRLIHCKKEGHTTTFLYDAFGRCLQITDELGTKYLLYQSEQEIGSLVKGQLQEWRLVHPELRYDLTFAIELEGQPFFPIQDAHSNICALQKADSSLAEWTHFSAFGEKTILGEGLLNPWRFANRREIVGLSLFTHRFYNPRLMRWQTPDPLGFAESLHLYRYARNHPFCYKDLDGQFAFVIPLVIGAFGTAGITISGTTAGALLGSTLGLALGWGVYKACQAIDHTYYQVEVEDPKDELEGQKKKKPRFCGKELGDDPMKCPGEGFEWKGRGQPETGKGNWVKGDPKNGTQEQLHPDFHHLPPKAPHWDYFGPDYPKGAELYLDGKWELKS